MERLSAKTVPGFYLEYGRIVRDDIVDLECCYIPLKRTRWSSFPSMIMQRCFNLDFLS